MNELHEEKPSKEMVIRLSDPSWWEQRKCPHDPPNGAWVHIVRIWEMDGVWRRDIYRCLRCGAVSFE